MSDDDMSHLIQAVLTGGEVPFGAETSALEYNILSFMLGGAGAGGGGATGSTPTLTPTLAPAAPPAAAAAAATTAAANATTTTTTANAAASAAAASAAPAAPSSSSAFPAADAGAPPSYAGLNGFPPLAAAAGMASALHMSDPPGGPAPGAAGSHVDAGSPAVRMAGGGRSASDSAGEEGEEGEEGEGAGAPEQPQRKKRRQRQRPRRESEAVNGASLAGAVGALPSGPGPGEAGTTAGHAAAHAAAQAHARALDAHWRARVRAIYQKEIEPFHYTEGYHFLLKYAAEHFDQAAVLRVVRALALFRPSLIALQMPMTQDDEVFVERSIQRIVLEFEKLISFSGTPTLVWRRTCEICAVGAEFSKLTQWPRHELVGKHIYELFDTNSALDYWEKFALHAFENTHQSIMTVANVRMAPTRTHDGHSADGRMMRCAVCYSIKRDVFDLPCLVVANFLPCLG